MSDAIAAALREAGGLDDENIEYLGSILGDPDDVPATREDLDELILPFIEDACDDEQQQASRSSRAGPALSLSLSLSLSLFSLSRACTLGVDSVTYVHGGALRLVLVTRARRSASIWGHPGCHRRACSLGLGRAAACRARTRVRVGGGGANGCTCALWRLLPARQALLAALAAIVLPGGGGNVPVAVDNGSDGVPALLTQVIEWSCVPWPAAARALVRPRTCRPPPLAACLVVFL